MTREELRALILCSHCLSKPADARDCDACNDTGLEGGSTPEEMLERLVTQELLPPVFLDPDLTRWACPCYWDRRACRRCDNLRRVPSPRYVPNDLFVALASIGAPELLRAYELLRPQSGYVAWGYTSAPDRQTFLEERDYMRFARSDSEDLVRFAERLAEPFTLVLTDRGQDASSEMARDLFAFHGGPEPEPSMQGYFVLLEVLDPSITWDREGPWIPVLS